MDIHGNPIPRYTTGQAENKNHPRVIDPEVAVGTRTLLEEPVNNTLGAAHSLRKTFPTGAICGKTGDDRTAAAANWFAGCTEKYTAIFVPTIKAGATK